jgi:hypothetical protein
VNQQQHCEEKKAEHHDRQGSTGKEAMAQVKLDNARRHRNRWPLHHRTAAERSEQGLERGPAIVSGIWPEFLDIARLQEPNRLLYRCFPLTCARSQE